MRCTDSTLSKSIVEQTVHITDVYITVEIQLADSPRCPMHFIRTTIHAFTSEIQSAEIRSIVRWPELRCRKWTLSSKWNLPVMVIKSCLYLSLSLFETTSPSGQGKIRVLEKREGSLVCSRLDKQTANLRSLMTGEGGRDASFEVSWRQGSLQTRSQRHRSTCSGSWRAGCCIVHWSRHCGCPLYAFATPRSLQVHGGLRGTVRASREPATLARVWSQGKENHLSLEFIYLFI